MDINTFGMAMGHISLERAALLLELTVHDSADAVAAHSAGARLQGHCP